MLVKYLSFLIGVIWSYSLIKTQSIFSKKAGLIFKVFISKVSWLTLIAAIYFGYKNFSIKFIYYKYYLRNNKINSIALIKIAAISKTTINIIIITYMRVFPSVFISYNVSFFLNASVTF